MSGSTIDDQLVVLATTVGAVAALPTLIDFLIDRRKRAERVALALEDEPVSGLALRLAGLDRFLLSNADLVDAIRDPDAYRSASTGNEILILGPPMSGKRSIAQWFAREGRLDRLITVHSPRDADVLAAAKRLLKRYRRRKVMLLLPNLDRVFDTDDLRLLSELDALIDDATEKRDVLVVATATRFDHDGELDNRFAVKLVIPGTPLRREQVRELSAETREMLRDVTAFYLDQALREGCVLGDLGAEDLAERVLAAAGNAAEVEDILVLCRTSALHAKRSGASAHAEIGRVTLERAIGRVIVPSLASS